jgi:hypothetical protein
MIKDAAKADNLLREAITPYLQGFKLDQAIFIQELML